MTKFISFENQQLLPSLQKVLGVADSKNIYGILSNVLFEKIDNKLRLTTTDNEIQISVDICDFNLENNDIQSICVNAKKLATLLKSFQHTDNCEFKFADNKEKMFVNCNRSRFSFQTNNVEDFPKLEFENNETETICQFSLKKTDFKKLLKETQFAIATNDIREYLNGLFLDIKPHKVITVATDGHRLAYSAITTENQLPETNCIIPRKTILELIKLVNDNNEENINLSISKSAVKFEVNNITLISKIIDFKFPDYNGVIATDFKYGIKLDRQELIKAIQQCYLVYANENNKVGGALFELSHGNLKLTTQNHQQEDCIIDIPIDYSDEAIAIGLNINFVLDKLNNIADDFVIMRLISDESTAMFSGYSYRNESEDIKALPIESDGNDIDNDGNFVAKTYEKYVVMPMRI